MKRLLKYTEVLEYLGICKSSAKYYHLLDTLPPPRHIGMSIDGKQMKRWWKTDIDEYIRNQPKNSMIEEIRPLLKEK